MGKVLMMRKGETHTPPITFPKEPTAYDNLVGTYTSSTTFTAPEDGYYEVQLFGASGAGGSIGSTKTQWSSRTSYVAIVSGAGGGGGGGGYSASRVKMMAGDTVSIALGTGTCTATINNTTEETYSTLRVTAGAAGGNGVGQGNADRSSSNPYRWPTDTSVVIATGGAGGSGGTASGGNYANNNGRAGGAGSTHIGSGNSSTYTCPTGHILWEKGTSYTVSGGSKGSSAVTGGRAGGIGQGESFTVYEIQRWVDQSTVTTTSAGAAQKGFCRIYRGNTNIVL